MKSNAIGGPGICVGLSLCLSFGLSLSCLNLTIALAINWNPATYDKRLMSCFMFDSVSSGRLLTIS